MKIQLRTNFSDTPLKCLDRPCHLPVVLLSLLLAVTCQVGIAPIAISGTIPNAISGPSLIRVRNPAEFPRALSSPAEARGAGGESPSDTICGLESRVPYGAIAPNTDGGTLNLFAHAYASAINASGQIAFQSQVSGSARNQGVFVAQPDGTLSAIAIGCGTLGGGGDTTSLCGDPSPIGGEISGVFFFPPAINDSGDVLFLSDVNGGSSRRALFLYRASLGQIVKVAAVGDLSPTRGVFGSIGFGSLNNSGKVVFLATTDRPFKSDIFMWDNGVVTKVAAAGDPAPGGGTMVLLGSATVGFLDGTFIPYGPVPDINNRDQISFRASVRGGITTLGLIVRTGGIDRWYVKVPDTTPIGGRYLSFEAASLNDAGQIAFFADYRPTIGSVNAGWFAGSPHSWRKVIVFGDPIDGGVCNSLAVSTNPPQPIDAAGNVVFWTRLNPDQGEEREVLGLSDGTLLVVAREGDPTPIGGSFGPINFLPSINGSDGTLGVATVGAPHRVLNAIMDFSYCPVEAALSSERLP